MGISTRQLGMQGGHVMLLPQPLGMVCPQVAGLQRAGTQHVPFVRHT
jgi:hypothetical protein